MNTGDRVTLSDSAKVLDFIRNRFAIQPGEVVEVLTEWDKDDIICWDYIVKTVDDKGNEYRNGFYENELRCI